MSRQDGVDALGETLGGAEALASAPVVASAHRLSRGAIIDRYVVIEFLGAGGMGQVFAAYDPELDRRVAIKLMRVASGASSQAVQSRLLREGKAMAKLSHPNVVIVHDVGTFEGDLFVAMELVDGTTLKAWLAEKRRPWREVLDVFVQAGRGLEAAHAAGIVHRDFKPDNVLVRKDGRVLVTDFGLARSSTSQHVEPATPSSSDVSPSGSSSAGSSPSDATHAGTLIGTPAYMAPEQLAGEAADMRSDQFSFCLALYEGLYGERPFDLPTISNTGEPDPTARDASRWQVTPPPRDTSVPAWLRRAVLRGLAGDPAARHPGMSDLLRELAQDPRTRRWLALGMGALVVMAGAGVAFSATRDKRDVCDVPETTASSSAWNAAAKARMRTAFQASNRPYWSTTFERVAVELDRHAHDWRAAWVDACRATHVRHEQSPALLDLRMQCLDRRARELGALVDLFGRDGAPEIVDKAVRAVAALPDTRECADAERLSTRVPLPSDPMLRQRIALLRARLDALVAEFRAGKAKQLVPASLALATETATVSYPPLASEAHYWSGEIYDELGDGKASEAQFRLALDAAAAGRDDIAFSRAINALVYVLGHHQQRYAEADTLAAAAEATAVRVGDERQRSDLAFFRGVLAEDRGHYAEARPLLEQALATRTKLLGGDHPEVASTHHNLAVVLDELGNYDAARTHAERAYAILEKALGPEHPAVGVARLGIGGSLRRAGKLTEARPHFEAALRIWQAAYGPEHPYVGMGLNNLLVLLHEMREHDAALEIGLRALAFKEKHAGPDSEATANTLANLGRLLRDMKRNSEARTYLERALAIRRKVLEPQHPDIATSLSGLALLAIAENRPADALPLVTEALAIREKVAPDHPDVLTELVVLARTHVALNRRAAAVPLLQRAVAIAAHKTVDAESAAEAKALLAELTRKP